MAIKSRVFNIMQYEKHPDTDEILLTEEKIKDALNHRTIKRWAYIRHDKDVYSALDVEAYEQRQFDKNDSKKETEQLEMHEIQSQQIEKKDEKKIKKGDIKPPHWHIVIEMGSNRIEVGTIAKWLGIKDNYVNVAKGAGAFLDCCKYLTHEDIKQQAAGKRLYEDTEVKSNFDFRKALVDREEQQAKYGRCLSEKEQIRYEVMRNGLSLRDVIKDHPLLYSEDYRELIQRRLHYIDKFAPKPDVRINYYIEGPGGMGKGLISRAIARKLIDPLGKIDGDENIFFEIGGGSVTFEGYDGQPVIIWNDCRAQTLIDKLGSRENVFNTFDLFPPSIKQNIKYSSIKLTNIINIVNSVQPWKEFMDGLCDEYKDKHGTIHKSEDKSQSYRRFPFFIILHEEDFNLQMNKGVFEGTREFRQYMSYQNLQGNFRKIKEKCGNNYKLINAMNGQTLDPVKDKYEKMHEKLIHEQQGTDEEIMAEFKNYGKQKNPGVIIIDAGD